MARAALMRWYSVLTQESNHVCLAVLPSQRPTVCIVQSRHRRQRNIHIKSHHGQNIGEAPKDSDSSGLTALIAALPPQCPGCGALTQTVNESAAGFYNLTRQAVRAFLIRKENESTRSGYVDPIAQNDSSSAADPKLFRSLAAGVGTDRRDPLENKDLKLAQETSRDGATPVCNRCHNLVHHNVGVPIAHPTLEAIQDTIAETPYRYNHIYHILDAADFPMSLIPVLQQRLSLAPQRTVNRRSRKVTFVQGRKAELSFVITRSDLLAPKKDQVDRLMPYLIQVLRDALGSVRQHVRFGNVYCVSAKRGWWTKTIKEKVWGRGGGGWMVGKVNVGKSNLLESILPKGRGLPQGTDRDALGALNMAHFGGNLDSSDLDQSPDQSLMAHEPEALDIEGSLLPPPPPELPFPVLPIVSNLPGTTASPIRLPFGNGKGELIDLPGLARSNLADYVPDRYKSQLVMRDRVKPKQMVVKPGQSLLVGGLVRITARDPDITLLAYPFLPFDSHVTSTDKAIAMHTQTRSSGVQSLLVPGAGNSIASAGRFRLEWDVTQHRAGPLTAKAAVGLKPAVLPFAVYSSDILIEGCGWVEIVAQVRKRKLSLAATYMEEGGPLSQYPEVDVYSPEGRFVGSRRPMEAWLRVGIKPSATKKAGARPRPSMKGAKKTAKRLRRQEDGRQS